MAKARERARARAGSGKRRSGFRGALLDIKAFDSLYLIYYSLLLIVVQPDPVLNWLTQSSVSGSRFVPETDHALVMVNNINDMNCNRKLKMHKREKGIRIPIILYLAVIDPVGRNWVENITTTFVESFRFGG